MLADDITIESASVESALAQMRAWMRRAYTQPDAFHGPRHAEEVLRLADGIAGRLPGGLRPAEHLIVSAAALLHDVGYTAYRPDWAPNRREHVAASITFARRQLAEIAPFAKHPGLIDAVSFLIGYHDDTSYKFPSFVWDGRIGGIDLGPYAAQLAAFEASLSAPQRERLHLLLAILREADALTAAGEAGAARSFQYAIHRGLPIFARGNPLNAWCWEESAAGNTRLAAKRAMIDAFTPEGRRAAWESYHTTEVYLQGICAEHAAPYVPEAIAAEGSDGPPTINIARDTELALELISYAGWDTLERTIHTAGHAYAANAQPPTTASMTLRRVPLDLLPHVSQMRDREGPQTAALASLHAHLLAEYALSLFDLAGIVEYRVDRIVSRTMPPIVERSSAATGAAGGALAILDGAAAIALARELGVRTLWVVELAAPPRAGVGSQSVRELGELAGATAPAPAEGRSGSPRDTAGDSTPG